MLAPSSAKRIAVARPMPLAPPVMSATLFSSLAAIANNPLLRSDGCYHDARPARHHREDRRSGDLSDGGEARLFQLYRGAFDRRAGEAQNVVDGNEAVQAGGSRDVNQGVATARCQGFVDRGLDIGIAKRNHRDDKIATRLALNRTKVLHRVRGLQGCGRIDGTFGDNSG